MRFYLVLLGLLMLFLSERGLAHSAYSGLVSDPSGNRISYVTIHNLHNHTWTVSDEDGQFQLISSCEMGDTLLFSRIGYASLKIAVGQETYLKIHLSSSPLALGQVNVYGQRDKQLCRNEPLVTIQKNIAEGEVEHRQILQVIPGLSIRSSGGPAGVTTLSLDGGPVTQTKIMVSGFDISNTQNGEMDISQLPVPFIENVKYIAQDENMYGSGHSEGTVLLSPIHQGTGITASIGSNGYRAIHSSLHLNRNRWTSTLLIGQRFDEGDYSYSWRDIVNNRENNHFNQEFAAGRFSKIISERFFVQGLFLHSQQERGISGLVWNPNPLAYRNDKLTFLGMRLGWTNPKGHGYLQTLLRHSWEHYEDPFIAINSLHCVNTAQIQSSQVLHILPYLDINAMLETKYDAISSSDTHYHDRYSHSLFVSTALKIQSWIRFQPSYRFDVAPNLFSDHNYNLKVVGLPGAKWLRKLIFQHGTGFRYPTFNDLFWKPGGNPNLKPENSVYSSLSANLSVIKNTDLDVISYYKYSRNMIQWTPINSYWQPQNIQKSQRTGIKMIFRWHIEQYPIDLFWHYSYSKTEDLTPGGTYLKRLRYAPKNSGAIGLTWQPDPLSFKLQLNYTGERIAMYSWPNDIILPEALLLSFSSGYTFDFRFGSFTLVAAVDNLSDIEYETIRGFPEPGRSFRFTFTYQR